MTNKLNTAASVRQRLLNISKRSKINFEILLLRYAIERVLYRLSISKYSDSFVLKGAMLFVIWSKEFNRPTRDIDLLGFGYSDDKEIYKIFTNILSATIHEEGLRYDPRTLEVVPIRSMSLLGGLSVKFVTYLGTSRINVHLDIGYGDVIVPEPVILKYPSLLESLPGAYIRSYSVYTVFAEKFEAIVRLGEINTRMKDFYDLWFITKYFNLNKGTLLEALKATFKNRNTDLPNAEDIKPFSSVFIIAKSIQWEQFLYRNRLTEPHISFSELISHLRLYFNQIL